jgi:hypothetical protein
VRSASDDSGVHRLYIFDSYTTEALRVGFFVAKLFAAPGIGVKWNYLIGQYSTTSMPDAAEIAFLGFGIPCTATIQPSAER